MSVLDLDCTLTVRITQQIHAIGTINDAQCGVWTTG